MNFNKVSVQEVKGSYFVYIPKVWAKQMKLEKGDKMLWRLDEGDHETLHLIQEDKHVKRA